MVWVAENNRLKSVDNTKEVIVRIARILTYSLFQQHKFLDLGEILSLHPAEIDAGWMIDGVPGDRIRTRNGLMVCESGDFLARDRLIPQFARGDLVAIMSAGAYGFSMASNYNSRPRPAEILISEENAYLIRQRECYEDLIHGETIPPFLLKSTPLSQSS